MQKFITLVLVYFIVNIGANAPADAHGWSKHFDFPAMKTFNTGDLLQLSPDARTLYCVVQDTLFHYNLLNEEIVYKKTGIPRTSLDYHISLLPSVNPYFWRKRSGMGIDSTGKRLFTLTDNKLLETNLETGEERFVVIDGIIDYESVGKNNYYFLRNTPDMSKLVVSVVNDIDNNWLYDGFSYVIDIKSLEILEKDLTGIILDLYWANDNAYVYNTTKTADLESVDGHAFEIFDDNLYFSNIYSDTLKKMGTDLLLAGINPEGNTVYVVEGCEIQHRDIKTYEIKKISNLKKIYDISHNFQKVWPLNDRYMLIAYGHTSITGVVLYNYEDGKIVDLGPSGIKETIIPYDNSFIYSDYDKPLNIYYPCVLSDSLRADIYVDSTRIRAGEAINIDGFCSKKDAEFYWEFGDGTTSNEAYPEKVYTEAGVFTVKLTVSRDGVSDTYTYPDPIVVYASPNPDLEFSTKSGTVPFDISITPSIENSTGIEKDFFYYVDNDYSYSEDPVSYTITSPGIYTAIHIVENNILSFRSSDMVFAYPDDNLHELFSARYYPEYERYKTSSIIDIVTTDNDSLLYLVREEYLDSLSFEVKSVKNCLYGIDKDLTNPIKIKEYGSADGLLSLRNGYYIIYSLSNKEILKIDAIGNTISHEDFSDYSFRTWEQVDASADGNVYILSSDYENKYVTEYNNQGTMLNDTKIYNKYENIYQIVNSITDMDLIAGDDGSVMATYNSAGYYGSQGEAYFKRAGRIRKFENLNGSVDVSYGMLSFGSNGSYSNDTYIGCYSGKVYAEIEYFPSGLVGIGNGSQTYYVYDFYGSHSEDESGIKNPVPFSREWLIGTGEDNTYMIIDYDGQLIHSGQAPMPCEILNSVSDDDYSYIVSQFRKPIPRTRDYISVPVIYKTKALADIKAGNISVEDMPSAADISLYPNPASDYVQIDMPASNDGSIVEISDLSGRTVLMQSVPAGWHLARMNLRALNPGCYIVTVTSSGHRHSVKLMIY